MDCVLSCPLALRRSGYVQKPLTLTAAKAVNAIPFDPIAPQHWKWLPKLFLDLSELSVFVAPLSFPVLVPDHYRKKTVKLKCEFWSKKMARPFHFGMFVSDFRFTLLFRL